MKFLIHLQNNCGTHQCLYNSMVCSVHIRVQRKHTFSFTVVCSVTLWSNDPVLETHERWESLEERKAYNEREVWNRKVIRVPAIPDLWSWHRVHASCSLVWGLHWHRLQRTGGWIIICSTFVCLLGLGSMMVCPIVDIKKKLHKAENYNNELTQDNIFYCKKCHLWPRLSLKPPGWVQHQVWGF